MLLKFFDSFWDVMTHGIHLVFLCIFYWILFFGRGLLWLRVVLQRKKVLIFCFAPQFLYFLILRLNFYPIGLQIFYFFLKSNKHLLLQLYLIEKFLIVLVSILPFVIRIAISVFVQIEELPKHFGTIFFHTVVKNIKVSLYLNIIFIVVVQQPSEIIANLWDFFFGVHVGVYLCVELSK